MGWVDGGDKGNIQFGRHTRVDENLAYVVGLDCDSVIHAHTDYSYVPGCSDACPYESVNKYDESVGIAAS